MLLTWTDDIEVYTLRSPHFMWGLDCAVSIRSIVLLSKRIESGLVCSDRERLLNRPLNIAVAERRPIGFQMGQPRD